MSGFATVALIGFGEVGQILARELAAGADGRHRHVVVEGVA